MRCLLALAVAALCGGCAGVVRYTEQLVDPQTGRTPFTRLPAVLGGATGFVLGIPVDVLALPVTWTFYRSQPRAQRDAVSVFLYPSWTLWQAGLLLGAPFDAIEWGLWRTWRPRPAMSAEDREALERGYDELQWDEYPVLPIYPLPAADGG